jgi:hypothetical protein
MLSSFSRPHASSKTARSANGTDTSMRRAATKASRRRRLSGFCSVFITIHVSTVDWLNFLPWLDQLFRTDLEPYRMEEKLAIGIILVGEIKLPQYKGLAKAKPNPCLNGLRTRKYFFPSSHVVCHFFGFLFGNPS